MKLKHSSGKFLASIITAGAGFILGGNSVLYFYDAVLLLFMVTKKKPCWCHLNCTASLF